MTDEFSCDVVSSCKFYRTQTTTVQTFAFLKTRLYHCLYNFVGPRWVCVHFWLFHWHSIKATARQQRMSSEVKTFILSHFLYKKPFFKRYYFIHCRNDNNKIIHWLIAKLYIHAHTNTHTHKYIYLYIYIFDIQNTLHIWSSTDPFFQW